jgi:putative OPT family oligopeptide transporter
MVASGAGIGILIIFLDEYLRKSGKAWRAPVLAVAVGLYLPLELSVPILIGGLIAHSIARIAAREGRTPSRAGILFAAGLITGEALLGIGLAVPIVITGESDVLALGVDLPVWIGIVVVIGIALLLHRIAQRQ